MVGPFYFESQVTRLSDWKQPIDKLTWGKDDPVVYWIGLLAPGKYCPVLAMLASHSRRFVMR